MPIISVGIMKTIHEREMQETTKEKQRQKEVRRTKAIVKWLELNDFAVHLSCGRSS